MFHFIMASSEVSSYLARRLGRLQALLLLAALPTTVAFRSTPIRLEQPRVSTTSLRSTRSPSLLNAVSQRQTFIIDGGELQSFLLHSKAGDGSPSAAAPRSGSWKQLRAQQKQRQVGALSLVTGTTDESPPRRIVAVAKNDDDNASAELGDEYETVPIGNVEVYKHTIASIPSDVSDADALSTAAACLVGIHCAIPKVEDVGGSDDDVFYSGKVRLFERDACCMTCHGGCHGTYQSNTGSFYLGSGP